MNQKEAAYNLNENSLDVKLKLAKMLVGGVIVEVSNADEARIAEEAGALAVVVSDSKRVPLPSIRRMADLHAIKSIQEAVSIPIIVKCRIGHFVEAQLLEGLFVDFIDESETLDPADREYFIYKHDFQTPFISGCRNLGEALRRIAEGTSLIRIFGEMGTGDIAETVRHLRDIQSEIRRLSSMNHYELINAALSLNVSQDLIFNVAAESRLSVPNFAAGGVSTPADAILLLKLGAQTIFIESDFSPPEYFKRNLQEIIQAVAAHVNKTADHGALSG